ncbi:MULTISPECIES: 2Fe-2S iron-sulfur cluster binding domain-containing protein [unclassified Thermosynechococcus]|uniref:2Fe-2S iron-sulfur cluster-binding protein n=1 Tax=unclassified Thermosynechococcus TaxID=2622553 RepID=UPI0019826BC3|nr:MULTISPECIES: 2Fe-2S iron-sulfur cluster binding domain-containing protein [unclassified Thermosynechococcus]QSF49701.1 2Fe-2S iron-sulfur cluster binding domain-containing protein [Thermosynechococcus sp. TA-1]WNC22787.1 2Fe-2S iron-sulfur cluster binding domain-containing protein [Thermosynechococcus sp. PP22]WNC33033.1 2Fe-2S iron-sulfur cluster binding domain-containing protein [Thermosynechococcus sp. PKX95]WNC35559.1 2Fe-2S iron-sulfur cluster binding domain-containing protein [Thermos
MIKVTFVPDQVSVEAEVGESWLSVAARAGVDIPTGCCMGSCGACTLELEDGEEIRACISTIAGDRKQDGSITAYLFRDPTW